MTCPVDVPENVSGTQQGLVAQPGDIVLTTFGIAVCVRSSMIETTNTSTSLFKARIWRVPGKSVGSAAVAFLRHDTVRYNTFEAFLF